MPAIVRGIRHNDIFRYPPPRASRPAPGRASIKDAAKGAVQFLQRIGAKVDIMTARQAYAEATLDRIGPVVTRAAEQRAILAEQRVIHDAMVAHNARRDERLQAIRDGKPIRPETPAEMAAIHARHYGRVR